MSLPLILQIAFNFFLLSGLAILWARHRRTDGDDPRMSRSLQLLQSKISILEDLSDRIDEQLTQATALMEHKRKELDSRIGEADRTISVIQQSRDKSLEVAKIFQDKIPHAEIIERQRTIEYVKAARLAHQGITFSEIARQVDLPAGEVELIVKMNREQLQFSPEELPEWAREALDGSRKSSQDTVNAESTKEPATQEPVSMPHIEFPSRPAFAESAVAASIGNELAEIGERLRKAAATVGEGTTSANINDVAAPVKVKAVTEEAVAQQTIEQHEPPILKPRSAVASNGKSVIVQKIVFPKLEVNQHLS